MFDNRNLKLDLCALGLLATVIFSGLALVSYDPADPLPSLVEPLDRLYQPDILVHPTHTIPHNICGKWGALLADLMLNLLGLGSYYLVFSLGVLDLLLLRRQSTDSIVLRTFGWLASLVGLTALAATLVPGLSPGPVIGSGGYLGALVATLLEIHFALTGSVILAVSLTLGGVLLCTDYTLLELARKTVLLAIHWGPHRRAKAVTENESVAFDTLATAESDFTLLNDDVAAADMAISSLDSGHRKVRNKRKLRARLRKDARKSDGEHNGQEPTARQSGGPESSKEASKTGPPLRIRQRRERSERDEVIERLNEAVQSDAPQQYELPDIKLLSESDDICFEEQEQEVRRNARTLEKTFADFGFKVKVVEIETGPVIAQYEVQLEAGLRLSKITGLADDLAIALRVPSVRIVAPIPGKNTVGIEVPNETRQIVRLRDVMEEVDGRVNKMRIPIFLGKDVSGNPLTVDLSTLPHLLIAGRTGTGKSVCLNAIISSILMTRQPDEVRMLMIDPKMVELCGYGRLPHLMHPVVTDMRKAEAILAWAVDKMEERYALLAQAGVRHITSYNQLGKEELQKRLAAESGEAEDIPEHLPFIVIVADEIADLMMTAGKEVEQHIIRLAQKSRAVGIHLILATQKPTVDVITGLIKSNLPARISFQVASRTDSRVVLDEMGAEKLLGNGDMLFLWPGTSNMLRGQGTYLSDDEINAVVERSSQHRQEFVDELVNLKVEEADGEDRGPLKKRDDLYESAVDIVVREGRGSCSLLQRALGVGYGRAARLIDFMAEDNIVGPYAGSQAREVMISLAEWETMQGETTSDDDTAATDRSNQIPLPDEESFDDTLEPELREIHGLTRASDTDDSDDALDPEGTADNRSVAGTADEEWETEEEADEEWETEEEDGEEWETEEEADEEWETEEEADEEWETEEEASEEWSHQNAKGVR